MLKNCNDVFQEFDLPFETYFSMCIEHGLDVHEEMELIWLIRGSALFTSHLYVSGTQ